MRLAPVLPFALIATLAHGANATPEDEPEGRVAADSRAETHTVPDSTDYGEGFDAPVERRSVDHRWYGWQTLTSDAISIGVFAAGMRDDESKGATFVGLFGYLFGAPFIHGMHRQTGKSLGSFALRAGLPTVGAIVGYESEGCDQSNDEPDDGYLCGVEGAMTGLLLGTAIAIAVDAAVLAHEEVEPDAPNERSLSLRIRPDISVSSDRGMLQLSGVF
jgi:hypothetical protein